MNDLIRINLTTIGGDTIQTVNARDLHVFLEIGRDFSHWVKERIEQGGFADEIDFITCSPILASTHNRIDYFLSLDMAKHIAMMERNEKGKTARQYFIECENRLKQVPATLAKATISQPVVDALYFVDFVATSLHVSDASRLRMYSTLAKRYDLPHELLPTYTTERLTKSLTDLLKDHPSGLTTRRVNLILLELGVVEEKVRTGSKGQPQIFKMITEYGLRFGKNLISPQNERETQPHYYEDKFPELMDLVQGRIKIAA